VTEHILAGSFFKAEQKMSNSFMVRAIQLSIESVDSGGGPFGAVVVKNGEIIAEGFNQVTTTNDPTAHAEMVAIRKACAKLRSFELKDCELYTSCEPCPMCLGAIYWARMGRIYFANTAEDAAKIGFDDSFIYGELKQPHEQRRMGAVQMMREEALAGFRAWSAKPDKTLY
jgi:guanine deaminase